MNTLLKHNLEMVGHSLHAHLVINCQADLSRENFLEAFVQLAHTQIGGERLLSDQALLHLVVSSFDQFVPGVPILPVQFVEEAAVFDGEHFLGSRWVTAFAAVRHLGGGAGHALTTLHHGQVVEQELVEVGEVVFFEQLLVTFAEHHQVVDGEVKVEALAILVVEGHDSQACEWQVILKEINCQIHTTDVNQFSVSQLELLHW